MFCDGTKQKIEREAAGEENRRDRKTKTRYKKNGTKQGGYSIHRNRNQMTKRHNNKEI